MAAVNAGLEEQSSRHGKMARQSSSFRRSCRYRLWHSVTFWRWMPWIFALGIIGVADFFTLLFGTGVFEDCPQAIATWDLPPRARPRAEPENPAPSSMLSSRPGLQAAGRGRCCYR